jgi:hypothetical protein
MDHVILAAKLRVAVRSPRAVVRFRNAISLPQRPRDSSKRKTKYNAEEEDDQCLPDYDEVAFEVHDEDPYHLTQVLVFEDRGLARIRRITNPAELAEGQRPPFRYRPRWEVTVAQGVDVALIAVVIVILGQQVGGDGHDSRGSTDI